VSRRTFFSFDFTQDVFRANQVRNANVVGVERAGYYDHSEYEEAKKKGNAAIGRMIRGHLEGTTVTVLLVGARTVFRPWVRFEIDESIKRGNGLIAVRIHHLYGPPCPGAPWMTWECTSAGQLPWWLPPGVQLDDYGLWDGNLERFRRAVEAAGQRADRFRRQKHPLLDALLDMKGWGSPGVTSSYQPVQPLSFHSVARPPSAPGALGFGRVPSMRQPPAAGSGSLREILAEMSRRRILRQPSAEVQDRALRTRDGDFLEALLRHERRRRGLE
jgi:hypothetical protein